MHLLKTVSELLMEMVSTWFSLLTLALLNLSDPAKSTKFNIDLKLLFF